MKKEGLPANVNPFSVITNYCICDALVAGEFPNYFRDDAFNKAMFGCFCRARKIKHGALNQKEAELLIAAVVNLDPIMAIAVKEVYQHVIPENLQKEVPVVRTKKGQCLSQAVVNPEVFETKLTTPIE